VDPSGLRALSIAGGGRKRAKECIAAALGLGVVEEEEEEEEEEEALHGNDHGVHAGRDLGTDRVIIERVSSSISASSSGHSGFKKLAVDLLVKIFLGSASIYVCMYVCMYVCILRERERETRARANTHTHTHTYAHTHTHTHTHS
jgi:hypothetical protein